MKTRFGIYKKQVDQSWLLVDFIFEKRDKSLQDFYYHGSKDSATTLMSFTVAKQDLVGRIVLEDPLEELLVSIEASTDFNTWVEPANCRYRIFKVEEDEADPNSLVKFYLQSLNSVLDGLPFDFNQVASATQAGNLLQLSGNFGTVIGQALSDESLSFTLDDRTSTYEVPLTVPVITSVAEILKAYQQYGVVTHWWEGATLVLADTEPIDPPESWAFTLQPQGFGTNTIKARSYRYPGKFTGSYSYFNDEEFWDYSKNNILGVVVGAAPQYKKVLSDSRVISASGADSYLEEWVMNSTEVPPFPSGTARAYERIVNADGPGPKPFIDYEVGKTYFVQVKDQAAPIIELVLHSMTIFQVDGYNQATLIFGQPEKPVNQHLSDSILKLWFEGGTLL